MINFIRIKEFDTTLEIPKIFEYTGVGYLGGKTINELLNAEAESTKVALIDYSASECYNNSPKSRRIPPRAADLYAGGSNRYRRRAL